MDGGKKPLKRLFPGDTGLSGCIKISTDYTETITEWMGKLEKHFSKGLTFIPYVMGIGGLETIEDESFSLKTLEELKTKRKQYGQPKIYAMVKGKGNLT